MAAFVVSNDRSDGSPNVPNANASAKWKSYLWRRNRAAGSGLSTSLYVWDDSLSEADATYLNWVPVGNFVTTTDLTNILAGSTKVSLTVSGGNLYFDVVEGNIDIADLSGSLPESKLPSTVPLTDEENTFAEPQTFSGGLSGVLTGNASSATKLKNQRVITLTGDATGTVSGVDWTSDVTINTTVTPLAVESNLPHWNASHLMTRQISNALPTDGQVYAWNNITALWEPSNSPVTAIDEIYDVTITSVQNRDHLIYNSTSEEWENASSPALLSEILANGGAATSAALLGVISDEVGSGKLVFAASIDTDLSTTSASDDTLASAKAIKAYVDTRVESEDTIAELNDTAIGTLAAGHILVYDGTDTWDNKALSGDASLASNGAVTLTAANTSIASLSGLSLSPFVIEGAADDHETTVTFSNPAGSDKTITFADVTGTVITTGNLSGITSAGTMTALQVDNININGNAITSTDSNGNIALTPNGTGEVDISKVDINGGTIDGATIGAVSATTGKFTAVDVDNININGNAITSTDSNGNIALTPNGTGGVSIGSELNLNSNKITNLLNPTADQDAATKNYVDTQVATEDTLAELNDTTLTSPADSHFLVHNGTLWVNETGGTARTSLGVDAAGTDNSTDVTLATVSGNYLSIGASNQVITAGTVPVALGGTGSTTASDARTALGLAIGSDVQAHDAQLDSLSGWTADQVTTLGNIGTTTTAADKMIYTTAADTFAEAAITATGRSLLDDSSVGSMRSTLGVDAAGTDNSTDVTLDAAGTYNYITISGDGSQVITRGQVDLTTDVTGNLPDDNIASSGTWDAKQDALTFDGVSSNNANPSTSAQIKSYVDAVASGLDLKDSAHTATTATLSAAYDNGSSGVGATLTNSGSQAALSIDGQAMVADERVLVKDQTTAKQNGIYTVTNIGSGSVNWILTRTIDFDSTAEVTSGAFTFVETGAVNSDSGWVMTEDAAITIGTTAISWAQFSGAGQITAGGGLTKDGNTLDVGGTTNRISVSTDAVDIHSSYVGQSSITTLGTITGGAWQSSSKIAPLYGGTGQDFSSSTGALLVDSGTVSAGTLGVSKGGTGAATLASNSVLTGNGTSAIAAEANLTFDGSTLQVGSPVAPTSKVGTGAAIGESIVLNTAGQSGDRGAALSLGGFFDNGATTTTIFGSILGLKSADDTGNESGYLSFQTNNVGTISEQMSIASDGDVLIEERLGIGASPTTHSLEVTGNIQVNNSSGANDSLYMGSNAIVTRKRSTGAVIIQSGGGDVSLRDSGGTDKLILDNSTGNIGIGEAAPAADLEIKGNLSTALPDSTSTSSGTDNKDIASTAHGLAVGDAVKFPSGSASAIEIFTVATVTDADNFVVDSNVTTAGAIGQGYKDSDLFGIRNGDDVSQLLVDKSGNIGVGGVTSPNASLHVGGTAAAHGDATNPAIQVGGAGTYRLGLYTTAEGAVIDAANGDDGISFHTKDVGLAMTITSAGLVGIGEDDPSATLSVARKVASDAASLVNTVSLSTLSLKTHLTDSTVTTFGGVSGGGGYIQRSNGAGSTAYSLVLNPFGGNVGIGSATAPSSKLHIVDGGIRFSGTGSFGGGADSGLHGTGGSTGSLTLITAGNTRMSIASDGDVKIEEQLGIGCNPGSALDVTHSAGSYGTAGIISQRAGTLDNVAFGLYDSTQKWDLVSITSSSPYFAVRDVTNSKTPFYIFSGAASDTLAVTSVGVGIGTTSPTAHLGFESAAFSTGTEDGPSIRFNNSVTTADSLLQSFTDANVVPLLLGMNAYINASPGSITYFNTSHPSSYVYQLATGQIDFGTASSGAAVRRMSIEPDGDVKIEESLGINVTPSGGKLHILSTDRTNLLYLEETYNTNGGAYDGPTINLYRNRATPEAGDEIGKINFTGNDKATASGGAEKTFSYIKGEVLTANATNGQYGGLLFGTVANGSGAHRVRIEADGTFDLIAAKLKIGGSAGSTDQVLTVQSDGTIDWATPSGGSGTPAGSVGEIQFNSGSSTFDADSNLFWDDTNKRLSVGGDNTPSYALQVEGGGSANETVGWFNNQGAYVSRIAVRNSSRTAYISIAAGTGDTLASGTLPYGMLIGCTAATAPIQFYNGLVDGKGIVRMTIEADGDVKIEEQLGIGITPTEALHISGTSPAIKVEATNDGGQAEIKLIGDRGDDDADKRAIVSDGSLHFKRQVSGSWETDMRIDPAGLVGIGCDPNYKLDVAIEDTSGWGVHTFSSGGVGGGIFADASSVQMGSRTDHHLHLLTNSASRLFIDDDGDVKIEERLGIGVTPSADGAILSVNQSSATEPVLRLGDTGNADYDWTFPDSYKVKFSTETTSTKDFIINNEGSGAMNLIVQDGNVGIGVTPESWQSTYSALQIGGTGSLYAHTGQEAGANVFLGQNEYRDSSGVHKYIVTDEASSYFQSGGTHTFRVAASGEADAAISWTDALTIEADGDVKIEERLGIGGDPTSKLTVCLGDNEVVAYESATNNLFQFWKEGSTEEARMNIKHGGATKIHLRGNGNSYFTGGNIGIGEDDPDVHLHVNSGAVNECARFESTDTEVTLELKDTTGTAKIKSRHDFRFEAGDSERMRINTSGALGFGGENYGSSGQVLTSGGNSAVPTWSSAGSGTVSGSGTNDQVAVWNSGGNGIEGTNKLAFTSAGLGIGTDTPTSPAEVARILEIEDGQHAGIVLHDTTVQPWEMFANGVGGLGSLIFRYNNDTTTGATFQSDGDIKFEGNVGIGTAAPDVALDVHGNIHIHTDGNGELAFGDTGHVEEMSIVYDGGGQGDLAFKRYYSSNWWTQLFLDRSTGNVGVGLVKPHHTLHVAATDASGEMAIGAMRTITGSASDGSGLGFLYFGGSEDSGATWGHGAGIMSKASQDWVVGSAQGANLHLQTTTNGAAAPSTKLMVQQDGNIGVGTAIPAARLSVQGTADTLGDSRRLVCIDDDTAMAAGVGGGIAFGGAYKTDGTITRLAGIWAEKENATTENEDGQLHLGTRVDNGTISSDLVIDSDGDVKIEENLGVGTAAPGSALWTGTKNITIEDTAVGYFLKNSTSGLELNIASDSSGVVYFDIHGSTDAADNAFAFRTENSDSQSSPTERMRITSGGRVTVKKASNSEVDSTTLVSSSSITPDFDASNNFSLTLGHSVVTINNPSGTLVPGQSGCIVITQDGSGDRDIALWGDKWHFEDATGPTLSTDFGSVDTLVYYVASTTSIQAVLIKNFGQAA